MQKKNVVIFPPCGENVGLPTKRGANKENLFGALLPRLSAVLPPQGREIAARGFTLIELLVVVLIIGILSSVAVPQYQKAVAKTRYATLKNLVSSINQAQELYYLHNGKYTANFENLILQMPQQGELNEGKNTYTYDWGSCVITELVSACKNNAANMTYQKYHTHIDSSSAGQTKCLSRNNIGDQICLQETQDTAPISYANTTNPYKVYIYQ